MKIVISPEKMAAAEALVATGRYHSIVEVVEAGIDLMTDEGLAVASLRAAVQIGIDEAEGGLCEAIDFAEIKRLARRQAQRDQRGAASA